VTLATVLVFKESGLGPETYSAEDHRLTGFISHPDFFSFFIAFVAGIAGVLSLTSGKSGALVGVLVSVTTIPAAANIGVATTYGDWEEALGATAQLAINLTSIVLAGVLTLFIQRTYYVRRRHKHLSDPGAHGRRPAHRAQRSQGALTRDATATPRYRSSCARARSPRS
jgi:uncharacterized membrane protein